MTFLSETRAKARPAGALALALLVLALLLLATGRSRASAAPNARAAGGAGVTVKDYTFRPRTLVIRRGSTVRFSNRDQTNHTVTANHGSLGISNLVPGHSATIHFTHSGVYRYHCAFHPFMHGTIVIR